MKKTIIILAFITFQHAVFAQDAQTVQDKKPDYFTNWSIQTSLGQGNPYTTDIYSSGDGGSLFFLMLMSGSTTSTDLSSLFMLSMLSSSGKTVYSGTSYQNHFKAEFKPKYWGFQFGLSTGAYTLEEQKSPIDLMLPLMILGSTTTSSTSSLLLLSMLDSAGSSNTVDLSLTTFDFAATLHTRPFATFDPYLVAGIGIGACGGDCSLGKVFGKIGFRLNVSGGYIFLEGQKQVSYLKFSGSPEATIEEGMGLFGFGLYL